MKKLMKVMLALVLVAGALFTNVSGFVGADTAITAEAASSKNPRYEGKDSTYFKFSVYGEHDLKSLTINGKKASPDWMSFKLGGKNTRDTYEVSLKKCNKGSNRVEVHDNKGYWVVFYVNR